MGTALAVLGPLPKAQQVMALLRSRSVHGLSYSMFASELVCYVVSALYHAELGYPLHTYGETVALAGQNVLILALFARWQASRARDVAFVGTSAALASLSAALFRWHRRTLSMALQKMMVVMSLGVQAGRVPQMLRIYRTGDSGQLSPVQFAANCFGCLMRLYTTAAGLGADRVLVGGYLLSILVNGTLLGQILACRRRCALSNGYREDPGSDTAAVAVGTAKVEC